MFPPRSALVRKTSSHFLLASSVVFNCNMSIAIRIGDKNVVEIVRDAAGECANGLHSLSAKKLRLHSLLLGDVSIDHEDRSWVALFISHQRPATLDDDFRAVATNLMNFTAATLRSRITACAGLFKLRRRLFEKQLLRVFADRFLGGPAVDAARLPCSRTECCDRDRARESRPVPGPASAACSRICSSPRLRSVMSLRIATYW